MLPPSHTRIGTLVSSSCPREFLLIVLTWLWLKGTEVPFKDVNLWALYKTVENYRRQAGEAIDRQIEAGFLLPEDAEILRRDTIEQVSF